jgi:hypothetical protein
MFLIKHLLYLPALKFENVMLTANAYAGQKEIKNRTKTWTVMCNYFFSEMTAHHFGNPHHKIILKSYFDVIKELVADFILLWASAELKNRDQLISLFQEKLCNLRNTSKKLRVFDGNKEFSVYFSNLFSQLLSQAQSHANVYLQNNLFLLLRNRDEEEVIEILKKDLLAKSQYHNMPNYTINTLFLESLLAWLQKNKFLAKKPIHKAPESATERLASAKKGRFKPTKAELYLERKAHIYKIAGLLILTLFLARIATNYFELNDIGSALLYLTGALSTTLFYKKTGLALPMVSAMTKSESEPIINVDNNLFDIVINNSDYQKGFQMKLVINSVKLSGLVYHTDFMFASTQALVSNILSSKANNSSLSDVSLCTEQETVLNSANNSIPALHKENASKLVLFAYDHSASKKEVKMNSDANQLLAQSNLNH